MEVVVIVAEREVMGMLLLVVVTTRYVEPYLGAFRTQLPWRFRKSIGN